MQAAAGSSTAPLSMKWKWPVYLLTMYPFVDYVLHIHPLHPLGAVWAKLLLAYLAFLAVWRRMEGVRMASFATYRMMLYFILLGLAFVALGAVDLKVTAAGYEIDFMYTLIALLLPFALTREDVVPMLKWMAFTCFLLALHGFYEYAIRAPIPSWWNDLGKPVRTRAYSVFWSPNAFSDYLAFVTPISLSLALYEQDRGQRWFYGIAALVSAGSLVFTEDRGALLAFLAGMFIWTWFVDKRLTLGLVVLAVLSYFTVHSIHARMQEFLSPVYWSKTFANGRIAEWENAYNLMVANPLFGNGLGTYGGAVAANNFGIQYVDGFYAFMIGETGLLGFGSYIALISVYAKDVWRVRDRCADAREKILLLGVFTALLVSMMHAVVENTYQVPALVMTFWMTGVLALVYGGEVLEVAPDRAAFSAGLTHLKA